MRTHNRIIAAGLGLITVITMAACGTDTPAAKPSTDSKPAATASAETAAPVETVAPAECTDSEPAANEQINVRDELACKNLVVVTIVERNTSYIVAPFQRPLVMESRPKPGNVTCIFHVVHADYTPDKEPADFRITWGSKVKLTGNVVGNDAREGAEIKPGPVTVNFKDLNRDWLLNESGFDFRVCGSLEQH